MAAEFPKTAPATAAPVFASGLYAVLEGAGSSSTATSGATSATTTTTTTAAATNSSSAASSAASGSVAGWSIGSNFLLDQLQRKKQQAQSQPTRKISIAAAHKAALTNSSSSLSTSTKAPRESAAATASELQPTSTATRQQPLSYNERDAELNVKYENEYDPLFPNVYETYKRIQREKLIEAEERKVRAAEEAAFYREPKRVARDSRENDFVFKSEDTTLSSASTSKPSPYLSESPAKPAVPKLDLDMSGEEAFLARARLSGVAPPPTAPAPAVPLTEPPKTGKGGDVAERLMAKMGWKAGQGLGKQEQGISAPLTVQKTGKLQGIIQAPPVTGMPSPQSQPIPHVQTPSIPALDVSKATRVIVLKNMVGPGQVDDTLQQETADECARFGKVESCLIYEVPGGAVPENQAVRIFVKFDTVESARKAIMALNGRYFAKRLVRADRKSVV